MNELRAMEICPLDGRYSDIKEIISPYFSEYAYMKYRVLVEINWLTYLISKKIFFEKKENIPKILSISKKYNMDSYLSIKEKEKITNHDVKAVEYFINSKLRELNLEKITPFVHFGLTSEDINNISYALMIKDFFNEYYYSQIKEFISYLKKLSDDTKNISFLAHTHGQPATPTTVGKEFKVYWYRLNEEIKKLKKTSIKAKLNGATGNYSALSVVYPEKDIINLSKEFIESFDLVFNPLTTQIENHDYMVTILDIIRHINNIVLDLDIDMWLYISRAYFNLKIVASEVGSSTMPHKVNPINFENSESNLEIANSLLMILSNKLPRSRMQRDLSDSSLLRNLGIAFGYSLQGLKETLKGLKKIKINEEVIKKELEEEWEVLAEPIQTMLRKYGINNAYEKLKELTRGKKIQKDEIEEFIKKLNIDKKDKENLLNLTPENYIGLANKL